MTDSSFADDSVASDVASPEPAFYPLAGYALHIGRSDRAMADYLAACIESTPKDLLCHTRRIFVAMDLNDSEELFGALVDLFIVTGNNAFDLRANLLRQSLRLLLPAQQVCLFRQLTEGLSAQTPLTALRSRLTAGIVAETVDADRAVAKPLQQTDGSSS